MSFEIREKCIFCESNLEKLFFKRDIKAYIGHYCVDIDFKGCTYSPL